MILGALEAGGTKMVMCVGDENGKILEQKTIPTLTPEETMPQIIAYFKEKRAEAIGVASFGPLDLDPASPTYGYITSTPKLAWRNYPILPVLTGEMKVPAGFDTDVNAAALAECRLGAAKGTEDCLYLTVGTGIGGGLVSGGKLVHGAQHPEWGHIPLRPMASDPCPKGFCPSHESCAEGLASGPAMEKRWGMKASELPDSHPAWELEAAYLAEVCVTAFMTVSPRKVILGGGVMGRESLLPRVIRKTGEWMNGYLTAPCFEHLEEMIVRPSLFPVSGLVGALLLAAEAVNREH